MNPETIKAVAYNGPITGPKFFVLGAIHGNEKCGTIGCERVMGEIEAGDVNIVRGQVVFVPIGNPRAYDLEQRFVERNLNRYLVPMAEPDCYEARLGNILCPMLKECDVHLSIHSYTVGGAPFIFVAPDDEREHAFARSLGPTTLLTGWEQAYAATGRKTEVCDEEATGSIEYARRFGALAVNIECGQHKDPNAPNVAYHAIRNALRYLRMTDEKEVPAAKPEAVQLITVTHVFYRDDLGTFPKSWKHLEAVKKGEPVAFRADGSSIPAPDDGFIIMPKEDTPLGEEWFYFGVQK